MGNEIIKPTISKLCIMRVFENGYFFNPNHGVSWFSHLLSSGYEGAEELEASIFPVYSLLNGEP